MARQAPLIQLSSEERDVLNHMVRSSTSAQRDVLRARIILLAADGKRNKEIQKALHISKPVVVKWRSRFAALRLKGLTDEVGRGRKRKYDAETRHRIAATACTMPPESVGTHWSVRTLAKHLNLKPGIVHSVLSAEDIKPHRVRYWKTSTDPEFESKMLDIVGLYMNPPENVIVLSVDEKTSIQALDRTQPLLQMKPHLIERRSHEYKRNGTASLMAALEVHQGTILGQCIENNNSDTFIKFLKRLLKAYPDKELHLIVDNGSSHRSKQTQQWIAKQKRIHLHFTPTHGSWLNQIEIWFGILTRKIVRRGIFKSRAELVARIINFIEAYNQQARPFQWTYTGNPLAA
jgi:putative transposase